MRPRWLTLLLAAPLAGCVPSFGARPVEPVIEAGQLVQSGPWNVGCDNTGQCVMIGALPPRKNRMDGIRGALRVNLTHPEAGSSGMSVVLLDRDSERTEPDWELTPDQAAAVLARLRAGRDFLIWIDGPGGQRAYVPGQGYAAAVGRIPTWDTHQQPTRPEIVPVRPVSASTLGGFIIPFLTDEQAAACGAAVPAQDASAWVIPDRKILYHYTCERTDPLNPLSLWFIQQSGASRLTGIGLADSFGPTIDGRTAALTGASFDPEAGLLTTRRYAAPSQDCGTVATYALTPAGFVLAHRREMGSCTGIPVRAWLRTWIDPTILLPDGL